MALEMDAIIAILTGAAGVAGGFLGGKRFGHSQAAQISVDTVELLSLAVAELRTQVTEKDGLVTDLRARVEILESLVTQRAEVELVHEDVKEVRSVVNRIASKVGA